MYATACNVEACRNCRLQSGKFMKETIFITGIAGFIGSHIASEALKQGYNVKGIDVKDCGIEGIEFTKADIRDKDSIGKAMEGSDYAVHLAAITSNVEFEKNMYECYDINVRGFNTIIDAAAKKGIEMLYASSSAVYIDSFSEDATIDIKKQRNHYAKTKLMNEMVAQSYIDRYGMKAIGMRFFNVYGAGENQKGNYASIISQFIDAKKAGKPLIIYGDGKQARDFIHVDDVARMALELMKKADQQIYNIGTGIATSYNSIADMIDKDAKQYVKNPLSSYQYLTKADTRRINKLGIRHAITVESFIKSVFHN